MTDDKTIYGENGEPLLYFHECPPLAESSMTQWMRKMEERVSMLEAWRAWGERFEGPADR